MTEIKKPRIDDGNEASVENTRYLSGVIFDGHPDGHHMVGSKETRKSYHGGTPDRMAEREMTRMAKANANPPRRRGRGGNSTQAEASL